MAAPSPSPSALRIFGHPGSGNAFKPHLLASLLGVPAEFVQIDLGQTSTNPSCENNSAAFRALGGSTVPVLIDSRAAAAASLDAPSAAAFANAATLAKYGPAGRVVRDSGACLVYLALSAAAADPSKRSWFPVDDAAAAARVQTWLAFANSDVNGSLLHVRIALIFGWAIPGTVDEALTRSRAVLAALEARLAEGAAAGELWVASRDAPTIADVAVFPYVALAETSSKGALELGAYPAVCAWVRRVRALPGFVAQDGIFLG
jgi:glutathione S-transferase